MNPVKPRLVIFVMLAVGAARGAAAQYVPIDLGTLGGTVSGAGAVTDSGQVVGASRIAEDAASHAFVWTADGGMVDLGTLGGTDSGASAVNSKGQVVGFSNTGSGDEHAFSWTAAGGMVDLGTLGGTLSDATAVNASGQVVGLSSNGTIAFAIRAFSWTADGGMVDLGTLGGSGFLSFALDVNDSGQVVGRSQDQAFSWTAAGGMVGLGGGVEAKAVSESGQVVGYGGPGLHAFSWTADGGMVDLGTLGGTQSVAVDVNNSGQVVGTSLIAGDTETHASLLVGGLRDGRSRRGRGREFTTNAVVLLTITVKCRYPLHRRKIRSPRVLWTADGRLVDLPALAGFVNSQTFGVNNHGQVVGESLDQVSLGPGTPRCGSCR